MRRRRSLIGVSLIEGSGPEVGVLQLPILRAGRPPRHRPSISSLRILAACSPPARAGSFDALEPPLDRQLGEWESHASLAVKGSRLERIQNKVGTF
jgi:hypothetical protein